MALTSGVRPRVLRESVNERACIQRAFSLYRQFGSQHPCRGDLNFAGKGRFHAYSAGSHPTGRVNPFALEWLQRQGLPSGSLRSKSWGEFAQSDSPRLDFVFTVCDNAAGEICPVWPGQPITAHWGIEDPAAVDGDDAARRHAISKAFHQLNCRIGLFTALPLAKLGAVALQRELDGIGHSQDPDNQAEKAAASPTGTQTL